MNVSMQEHPKLPIFGVKQEFTGQLFPREYRRVSGNSPLRSPPGPRFRVHLPFCPPTSWGVCGPPTGAELLHPQQHSHEVRPVLDGDGSACRVVHKYGGVLASLGGTGDGGEAGRSGSSTPEPPATHLQLQQPLNGHREDPAVTFQADNHLQRAATQ